jgi:hypothetical protein
MDQPVRWTVRVSKETDVTVRMFLAQRGMNKGDLETASEVEAAISKALHAVRADRFRRFDK